MAQTSVLNDNTVKQQALNAIGYEIWSRVNPKALCKSPNFRVTGIGSEIILSLLQPTLLDARKMEKDKGYIIGAYRMYYCHETEIYRIFQPSQLIKFYDNNGKTVILGINLSKQLNNIFVQNNFDILNAILLFIPQLSKYLKKFNRALYCVLIISTLIIGFNSNNKAAFNRRSIVKGAFTMQKHVLNKNQLQQEGIDLNSMVLNWNFDHTDIKSELRYHPLFDKGKTREDIYNEYDTDDDTPLAQIGQRLQRLNRLNDIECDSEDDDTPLALYKPKSK